MQRIDDAKRIWIEVACEEGIRIPLPRTETQYSGKLIIRIPRFLHRRLAEQARREKASLNQYITILPKEGDE